MSKFYALVLSSTLVLSPVSYANESPPDSDGNKGLPLMILGIVAKPFLDTMVGKFYTWFGQKTGVPMDSPLAMPSDCAEGCNNNLQATGNPSQAASNANGSNTQSAFGVAVGAWVKPPRMPASEADLTQPQLWKKSSNGQHTEYTQVKLSILLTETGLVAVGVQDEGKPVQLRDTFVVGKPKDGGSQGVALFPIPSEKRIEVIRIKPTVARESLQVYVLPCQVTDNTKGADVGEGNEQWQDLQTQLPTTPVQFNISQLDVCPNASEVNWPDIYNNAQALTVSKSDKRLYGTTSQVQSGQWYKLEIPYATGL
jgi:hypothetical protein